MHLQDGSCGAATTRALASWSCGARSAWLQDRGRLAAPPGWQRASSSEHHYPIHQHMREGRPGGSSGGGCGGSSDGGCGGSSRGFLHPARDGAAQCGCAFSAATNTVLLPVCYWSNHLHTEDVKPLSCGKCCMAGGSAAAGQARKLAMALATRWRTLAAAGTQLPRHYMRVPPSVAQLSAFDRCRGHMLPGMLRAACGRPLGAWAQQLAISDAKTGGTCVHMHEPCICKRAPLPYPKQLETTAVPWHASGASQRAPPQWLVKPTREPHVLLDWMHRLCALNKHLIGCIE